MISKLQLFITSITILFFLIIPIGNISAYSATGPRSESKLLTVMDVPPTRMYSAYLDQYRLKPDDRFLKALDTLVVLAGRYKTLPDGLNKYHIKREIIPEDKLNVTLLKDGQAVVKMKLDLPISFSEQMNVMQQILSSMNIDKSKKAARPQRSSIWSGNLNAALSDFNMIDSRSVIKGMDKLEKLRMSGGDDSRLFLAAARGYAMLHFGLSSDLMLYKDRMFAAVLFSEGLHESTLAILDEPDSFSRYREFVRLQKLMAWLAMGQKPENLKSVFNRHYQKKTSDYYYSIGQYLIGIIELESLLQFLRIFVNLC